MNKQPLSKIIIATAIGVVVLPLLTIVLWSFTTSWAWPQLVPSSFTLQSYKDMFHSQGFAEVILTSIGISIAVAFFTTVIGALCARGLALYQFKGRNAIRMITLAPFLIPSTIFAMGIQVAFIKWGLADSITGVILSHTIVCLPYAVTLLYDVYVPLGRIFEEQSCVLGASPLRTSVHITIPNIAPGLISAAAISYIVSFSQYFLTLIIGGGNVRTLAVIMFPLLTGANRSIAAAYALLFLALTLLVFALFRGILHRVSPHVQETANIFNS